MRYILLLLILLSSFLFSENSSLSKEEILARKLFNKAFNKKSNIKTMFFPLRINNIVHNEILVKIDIEENVFIKKETVEYILSLLKKEYRKKIKYKIDKGFVKLSSLNQFGIEARYNSKDIVIDITIPPNLKKPILIDFNKRRKRDINGSILPEEYSGGANFYLNEYYKSNNSSFNLDKKPINLYSDMFLNIKSFVLEGRVKYKEEDNRFIRDRFKIVKDDKDNKIRYKVGDIFLPTFQRVSNKDVLGVSLEKKFRINSINSTENISRVSSYEFFLKNRSKIEIYINNKFSRVLNLNAGTHNLYNLGIQTGLNHIRLKIIEESGKVEFLEFNDFNYGEILKKGILKYGMGVGVSSKRENNRFIYNRKEKIFSGYIDYGLFNSTTLKSGIQATDGFYNYSLEFLFGSTFGLFNPYIIYSKSKTLKDTKRGFNYRFNINRFNLNLGYEETGEGYRRLDNYKIDNSSMEKVYRANLNLPISKDINFGIGGSKYIRDKDENRNFNISLYKNFSNKFNLRGNFEINKKNSEKEENKIYFTLNYTFGRNRLSYSKYYNENRDYISYNHFSPSQYGLSSINANYNHKDKSDRYYLRGEIKNEKFNLDTDYYINSNQNIKNQSLNIRLSSALLFAGDKTTISAPITSSFIIVDNENRLKEPLGIEGYQDDNDYIYNSFALPIGDYSQKELFVNESNLDFGIDLIDNKQKFITEYKSGSIMSIKVKNFMSVKGKIIDENQKPLRYKAFKLFNTITGKKTLSFTNANGEFTIPEMEIGKYNVTFVQEAGYKDVIKFTFEIKDDSKNLIDLGIIKVKLPPKIEKKKYFKIE